MAEPTSTQPAVQVATPVAPAPAPQAAPSQAPAPVGPQSEVPNDERLFAALGYFGPLFILPLIVKPKSAFCSAHARQSMVLFIMTVFVLVILAAIPMIGSFLTLGLFALYVIALYKAYSGWPFRIPVVASMADKISLDTIYGQAGVAIKGATSLQDAAAKLAGQAGDTIKGLSKQDTTPAPTEAAQPTPPPAAPAATPEQPK